MEPIVVEHVFAGIPVEKVWNTVTHLQKLNIWDFKNETYDLKVGGVFEFYEPGGTAFYHKCTITQFDENHSFEHTWEYPLLSKGTSTVQWNLSQNGNDTTLILKHIGTESFADGGDAFKRENFVAGWTEIVTKIFTDYLSKK